MSLKAKISLGVLGFLFCLSLFAEFITHSKPLVAIYQGEILFPAWIHYPRKTFGLSGAGSVEYHEIKDKFSFMIWPILPWDPNENDETLEVYLSPPNLIHILGTDAAGRDIFARLLYGARLSFLFSLCVCVVTSILGALFGLIQGFMGGKVDLIGQRLTEIILTLPVFYILIFFATLMTPKFSYIVIIASLFGWITLSRYMRGEALRIKVQPYCMSARALGRSPFSVMWKHVLPNSLGPMITLAPFSLMGGILTLAELDFLGFGIPPPQASLGELLDQAQQNFQIAWWLGFFPGVFLLIVVFCLNILGEEFK